MKKVLTSSVVVLMVLFLSAGLGLAGNGKGGGNGGDGSPNGTGISVVCSGTPIPITGAVSNESYLGSGLKIDTVSGIVAVYGIGPNWYWENEGVDRPTVGETITVSGMEVTFSDQTTKIIAMSITFEDDSTSIALREPCVDGVGGQPLWRGGRKGN